MIAIITGDIINSASYDSLEWMPSLKKYFNTIGKSSKTWEFYRGDEFQLRVEKEDALTIALKIKAIVKKIKGLDVRMAIGIGEETYAAAKISESNGSAYQYSGRAFNTLKKEKINLKIGSSNKKQDHTMNLMLKLALVFMDEWSSVSAELIELVLETPGVTQQQLAKKLKIQQSAVSQRKKRAQLDLVHELLDYFEKNLKEFA
jgi:hypothetical protein